MKQIFDWLREQCKDRSEVCYRSYLKLRSDEDYGCSFAYSHAVDLINEAEAKWEAEVCEWEHREHYVNCFCKCNGIMVEHDLAIGFKFCPYCGKPIKISEVE